MFAASFTFAKERCHTVSENINVAISVSFPFDKKNRKQSRKMTQASGCLFCTNEKKVSGIKKRYTCFCSMWYISN